jgi:acetylornithine/succinyldiaminopimelate/putrescine aminotransferase
MFQIADENGIFFDSFFIEPVLGEGTPGLSITPEFYEQARELTHRHGTMMVVDSIQAGIRAQGRLSIVDYPGFESLDPPDMETYSKALNGGQYPLSVLALTAGAAKLYVTGVYGNTMTANPRALEVGCAVLDSLTDSLRFNIRWQGSYFFAMLADLKERFPEAVLDVQGTGLIVCAELEPKKYPVMGKNGVETYLRSHGVTMVHGGKNGLRFTPHFAITKDEIDLIISVVEHALLAFGADRKDKPASPALTAAGIGSQGEKDKTAVV